MKNCSRRFAVVFAVMLLFIGSFAAVAAESEESGGPGYLVDFTTAKGLAAWDALAKESDGPVHGMAGKVKWEFQEEGYTSFLPKHPVAETAESGDTRMTAEMDFDLRKYRFLAICYRVNGRMSANHIYLKDNKGNTEYSSKDHTWLYPKFEEDGEWHVMVLDIAASFSGIRGHVKGIRIPVTDTKDSSFDIKYIGAFQTADEAEHFVMHTDSSTANAANTPAPTEDRPVKTDSENDASSYWIVAVIAGAAAAVVVVAVIVLVLTKRKK